MASDLDHHDRPTGQVVIVTGPAGSGKSTLAGLLADRLGWVGVSEDEVWVANGWGSGLRTREQEAIVQRQVVDQVRASYRTGRDVVLELVLYREPPNPVTAYQEAVRADGTRCRVVVLLASAPEIVRRMQTRGRAADLDRLPHRHAEAVRQLRVSLAQVDVADHVIDTTGRSSEDVYRICVDLLDPR